MRIALLSYRTKEHSGGQGVYVRNLAAGLAELGHRSRCSPASPTPRPSTPRVRLTKVPSLDLYREPDPFRIPRPSEFHDRDRRARIRHDPHRLLRRAALVQPARSAHSQGPRGRLRRRPRQPVARLRPAADRSPPSARRDHPPPDQPRPAPRARRRALVPQALRRPLVRLRAHAGAGGPARARHPRRLERRRRRRRRRLRARAGPHPRRPARRRHRPVRPRAAPERVPGRIVAVASADAPLKGVTYLLDAVAKLRTEREVELQLVCRLEPGGATERQIAALGLHDCVQVSNGLSDAELARLLASAEVMCVPSLYEGFSLPTVEALACATPVVASRAGALPEVLGTDGEAAVLVEPGDAEALATQIGRLLDDPRERARLGANRPGPGRGPVRLALRRPRHCRGLPAGDCPAPQRGCRCSPLTSTGWASDRAPGSSTSGPAPGATRTRRCAAAPT